MSPLHRQGQRKRHSLERARVESERDRLLDAEREQRLLAQTLREVTLALTSLTDPQAVLAEIVRQARRLAPFTTANIALVEGEVLRIAHTQGYPEEISARLAIPQRHLDALPLDRQAIESGKPVVVADTSKHPAWRKLGKTSWCSYISVPIILRDQVLGLLRLNGELPGQFCAADGQRLEPLANAAAIALDNARLLTTTQRQAEQLKALRQVSQDLIALRDLDTLLQQITQRAMGLLDGEAAGIYLYRPERDLLEWVVAIGNQGASRDTTLRRGEGLSGRAWESGKPQMAADKTQWSGLTDKSSTHPGNVIAVPIQWRDEFLGVLKLRAGHERGAFTPQEGELLEQFASQAAIAIHNARLFERATKEIEERRQAEAAQERLLAEIQNQAGRVQQLMETVPESVLLLSDRHEIILANPLGRQALRLLTDVQEGDVLTHLASRPLPELLTSPPQGLWHEITFEDRTFEVTSRPVEVGPMPKGWVLVLRDVTQEREIQQGQRQQERLAAVGQLAAGIAHDFNNIMSVIVLYAQIALRSTDLSSDLQERLSIISKQAHRATALIQQILDFSRRTVLERRPLDLLPIIKEEVKLLERTLPENVRITLDQHNDVYTVNADVTRMQQVVMNLAVNARDAMPDGGNLAITLDRLWVRNKREAPLVELECGEWVRISVSDNGQGIPPAVMPHIFEPFFTTKAPDQGTGLGLAQVYGIVKQHGGHIQAESQIGRGATFTVYLPALPIPVGHDLQEIAHALPLGDGETILLTEDNADTRSALANSLALLNYRVLEAANGLEALALHERYDGQIKVVLSDMVMPQMGGRALLRALVERDAATRVILMTGHPMEADEPLLSALGAAGWLHKPVSLNRLAETIAGALASG
jgi:two-component system cell cycle sensor histidine kinase/response regulator CckA